MNGNGEWSYAIYTSDRITDRKSAFLAHVSTLSSARDLPTLLSQLGQLPRIKRATHCMYAYRTREGDAEAGKLVCGQSDGGEGGSGDRLSRILELSGYENVAVVVWRWFGGVQLGSDRWRRISEVAKDALGKGQFQRNK
ncbi:ribosomal protein S5 domain 2-type protein [Cyathus striatus]|nr:ribosomal protein S5 domain 2-type protein [Cyathus striatus]